MFSVFVFYTGESVGNDQIPFSNYKKKKKRQSRQEEKDYMNDQRWEGK